MNTRGNIFYLRKTVTNYVKQQNTLGYNGINGSYITKNVGIHKTAHLKYPAAKVMTLPNNLQSVAMNKIGRFSPQRTRDMISQATTKAVPVFQIQPRAIFDPRVGCYDCTGAVNSMQSTVPSPFSLKGMSTHLHISGGQWGQQNKFISEDMQRSPYTNRLKKEGTRSFHTLTNRLQKDTISASRCESTKPPAKEPVLSRKDKLKRAVKEYGSTVIIFHVGISLVSLGTCYVLVSSGIDMGKLLIPLGVSGSAAANAGTFVTAYAIHKVFAPVRISITLGATPFIVRYLRNIGFLKKPKVQ